MGHSLCIGACCEAALPIVQAAVLPRAAQLPAGSAIQLSLSFAILMVYIYCTSVLEQLIVQAIGSWTGTDLRPPHPSLLVVISFAI